MLLNFHLPHYFSRKVNKEISELYANSAIANLALSMVMLFEPIFLYSVLGLSVSQILLFFAVVYGAYVVFIPWGGRVASVYGYKHAIAMSVPFQILYWVMLLVSKENTNYIFVAALAFALQKTLYWPGFHSLMARYADRQQVGREFGVVYALISLSHIVGPLIGGWLSQTYGMTSAFVTAAIIYCCSLLPLFKEKEIFIPKAYRFSQTLELYRTFPKKFIGYLGFGEELLVLTIWPVFMYMVIKNYEKTGIIATAASLSAALCAIFIGKFTDQYHKHVLIKMGAFFSALAWMARLIVNNVWNAFAVDTFSRTSKEMDFIPISTITYIRAESTHVVPYAVFFEQSLAIGKLLACVLGIVLLFLFNGSFVVLFILGALFSLLYMLI